MRIRLILLVALSAILGAAAVTALVSPMPQRQREGTSAAVPAGQSESASAPGSDGLDPLRAKPFEISAEGSGQTVRVRRRTEARLLVHAKTPVSIQLGDDGPIEVAEPGAPAEFTLFGEDAARIPIRRLEPERVIGQVEPAR